jgi:hypothetical protein
LEQLLMAIEGELVGPENQVLFVGADSEVVYTDADDPPTDMSGWTVVLDIRKKDTSSDPPLLSVTGVVSGVYANSLATNAQKVTFTLTDSALAATIFKGDDPVLRYSIKRTDPGAEQPLRYGDCPITRVTQA